MDNKRNMPGKNVTFIVYFYNQRSRSTITINARI